jgi:hypothetical protein
VLGQALASATRCLSEQARLRGLSRAAGNCDFQSASAPELIRGVRLSGSCEKGRWLEPSSHAVDRNFVECNGRQWTGRKRLLSTHGFLGNGRIKSSSPKLIWPFVWGLLEPRHRARPQLDQRVRPGPIASKFAHLSALLGAAWVLEVIRRGLAAHAGAQGGVTDVAAVLLEGLHEFLVLPFGDHPGLRKKPERYRPRRPATTPSRHRPQCRVLVVAVSESSGRWGLLEGDRVMLCADGPLVSRAREIRMHGLNGGLDFARYPTVPRE